MTNNSAPNPRRPFLKWLVIGLGIVCLLAIALPLGALKYSEHKVMNEMTPEQQSAFQNYYAEKTSISNKDILLEPFQEPLVRAVDNFAAQWEISQSVAMKFDKSWQDTGCNPGITLDDKFLAENSEYIADLEPLLDAFKQVVHQPDYSIEAWETLMPRQAIQGRYMNCIRSAIRLLCARGVMNAKAGSTQEAIEDADTLLAYGAMSPYNSLLHKMFGMVGVEYGLQVYNEVLAKGPDAHQEKQILDQLQVRLDSIKYYPEIPQDLLLLDHIGMTAPARRAGLKFSIQNLNGYEIMVEVMRVQRDYLEQVVLPTAVSDKVRKQIRADVAAMDESLEQFDNSDNLLGAYRNASEQVMAASSWMVATPAMERASDNAKKIFEDYNAMLHSLSKATQ